MNFDDYQHAARRTCNGRDATYLALGLAGETGELVDLIKKIEHHGHEMNTDALVYEMGDVLWYLANLAEAYGLDLEYIAEINDAKLRERYPEGYSDERSKNRTT